jgi:hypothetical protein
MIQQIFAALSLLLPSTTPPFVVVQPSAIPQVICFGKGYIDSGTAVRVGPSGLMLSVNHVTSSGVCFINGKPIKLLYKSPNADFTEMQGEPGPYIPIDCGGYVKGHKYLALGHARAFSDITPVELTATGETQGGESELSGMWVVVPGMSGGPVLDMDTGMVVGLVAMENFEEGLSWSVPLSQTPVCKA